MEFIGVAGLALLFFFLMGHQARVRDTRARALSSLASDREGWVFDGTVLTGRVGDATLTLSTAEATFDQAWSIEVVPDEPWSHARVTRRSEQTHDGEMQTGHATFDDEVAVVGSVREVLPSLDGAARAAIRRAVARGFRYDGRRWRFHDVKLLSDREKLREALAVACDLALHVRPVPDPDAVLEERLRRQRTTAARVELLRARLASSAPLTNELSNELLAPRDWGSLLVARHLQDEDWLFELAANGNDLDTRWDAVNELWQKTEDHGRLAAAIGPFVDNSPWTGTAIVRLERIGTVAEVPVLREVADRWLDEHRTDALAAIEAIKARARGSVGQLSLVEERPEAGALSVAQEAKRRAARQREG